MQRTKSLLTEHEELVKIKDNINESTDMDALNEDIGNFNEKYCRNQLHIEFDNNSWND